MKTNKVRVKDHWCTSFESSKSICGEYDVQIEISKSMQNPWGIDAKKKILN